MCEHFVQSIAFHALALCSILHAGGLTEASHSQPSRHSLSCLLEHCAVLVVVVMIAVVDDVVVLTRGALVVVDVVAVTGGDDSRKWYSTRTEACMGTLNVIVRSPDAVS